MTQVASASHARGGPGAGRALDGVISSCPILTCTGCPEKLFPLGYLLFCRLLLMQIEKVGTFLKNSGNLLRDRHKNFENRFRNN